MTHTCSNDYQSARAIIRTELGPAPITQLHRLDPVFDWLAIVGLPGAFLSVGLTLVRFLFGFLWLLCFIFQGFLIQALAYAVHDRMHRKVTGRKSGYLIGVVFDSVERPDPSSTAVLRKNPSSIRSFSCGSRLVPVLRSVLFGYVRLFMIVTSIGSMFRVILEHAESEPGQHLSLRNLLSDGSELRAILPPGMPVIVTWCIISIRPYHFTECARPYGS